MDFLTLILTIIIIFIFANYYSKYFSASNAYWEELNIPFVPRIPLIGNEMYLFRKPFNVVDYKHYKKYGRIYGSYETQRPVLTIADPDLIRQIWVKDFSNFTGRRPFVVPGEPFFDDMLATAVGDKWKRIRSTVSPTFATGKMKRMTESIINCAKTLGENIEKNSENPVDIKQFTNTFTMDVIASVAFGTKLHSYDDPNNEFVRHAHQFFASRISWKLFLSIVSPPLFQMLRLNLLSEVTSFFRNAVVEIIKHRRESGQKSNDFLQLMLEAKDEMDNDLKNQAQENAESDSFQFNIADEADDSNKQLFKSIKNFKALSNDEVVSQCILFFMAGFDTTSSTLTFAFKELAKNPEVQTKLREEIETVVSRYEGKVTYDSILEMKYLDNVLSEVLRLYPPGTRIDRIADDDYTFKGPNGTDVTIKKGTTVLISLYSLHRDPEYFPDPEKFNPERFNQEEKDKRHPYAYIPFGVGPRNCVAIRFAQVEVKLCLAYILKEFIILPAKTSKKEQISSVNMFGVLQPRNIMLNFQKRNNVISE